MWPQLGHGLAIHPVNGIGNWWWKSIAIASNAALQATIF